MLLSRHANYLFWFGRYLERTEHTTRFIQTQYDSVMESPSLIQKRIVYNSITTMYGVGNGNADLNDPGIMQSAILLSSSNPNSIISSVEHAKANTLNVRNIISVEIWEAVSRFRMYLDDSATHLKNHDGQYDFVQRVYEYCALIKNMINSTMLHDDSWAMVRFGIYLERAILINRILTSQVSGIEQLKSGPGHDRIRHHLLITLLKSLQAKDTYYKAKMGTINVENVSRFLVAHKLFPRSVVYNLQKCQQIYNRLFPGFDENDIGFELNKMADLIRYLRMKDFKNGLLDLLMENQQKIEQIAYTVERDHLQV